MNNDGENESNECMGQISWVEITHPCSYASDNSYFLNSLESFAMKIVTVQGTEMIIYIQDAFFKPKHLAFISMDTSALCKQSMTAE